MMSQLSYIMTLANSIIGVSVLAMPFCFKQCGIVLATLVLILSGILSRLACHFLIKSAVMSRRRNFELLAFHAFGHMGKFLVELFIIGFLVGTCIAFFVVMGDLGPQIVGKVIDKNPEDIRTSLLVTTSVFIVLPLGLLRNIDSLSSLCTATIIFYLCLILKIVAESMQHIFAGDWYEHVYYWRPSGILQCVPIFSMALFCQTQLFEIYETIPNVSLEKMNEVVRGALNICTGVYLCVGFFGYIAFCTQPFTGNILMSFEASLSSEMIKMGFVFSIAFSFPLVIFPCRASLNSLLFRRVYTHEPSINYLPETRFRCLTVTIVTVSLITGILIPNIEFVLGLVGSTIGVMICLIFPAIFFISISSKHTNERLLAQVILFIGICIMILSTYANLYALEESTNTKVLTATSKPFNQINNLPLSLNKDDINGVANVPNRPELLPNIKENEDQLPDLNIIDKSLNLKTNDIRQEPPIPVERIIVTEKAAVETQKPVENFVITFAPVIKNIVGEIKTLDESFHKKSENLMKNDIVSTAGSIPLKTEKNNVEIKQHFIDIQKTDNLINSDAIKKEESELAADAEVVNIMAAERHEKLRKTLEKHKQEQLQMMQEQKEILKDLKEQKQEIERQKQRVIKDTQEFKENEEKLKISNPNLVVPQMNRNLTDLNSNNERQKQTSLGREKEINSNRISDIKSGRMKLNEQFKDVDNENVGSKILKSKKELHVPVKMKNVTEKQSVSMVLNESSVLTKDTNDTTFNNDVNTEKKIKELKMRPSNSNELPQGPILNALIKRIPQKSISPNELLINDENGKAVRNNKRISVNVVLNSHDKTNGKIENQESQHEYSLPIALQIRNQSNVDSAFVLSINKSQENVQVIHRDILENHEREKREIVTKVDETNTKVISDISNKNNNSLIKNFTVKDDHEKCSKRSEHASEKLTSESKEKLNIAPIKNSIVDTSLIKTNVYLSEQEFANTVSIDSNILIRGEYAKLKQRDLKSMDIDGDYV
ncbi:uncharacterized protein LOC117606213 [Osmia lignaria lignaria]|uniref:uncharacterized protein LOC117606213 n=1 Tax=Osmia lignaria lignaria TaxID=1437193 RepID=UPI00402B9731